MTRKAVARAADVSERHLANLEYGTGNASILVLLQVAQALHCTLAELLEHRSEADRAGPARHWPNCWAPAAMRGRAMPALP